MVIERDGNLSTLCHSCGLARQQRVLKRFLAENGYSETFTFLGKFGYTKFFYSKR